MIKKSLIKQSQSKSPINLSHNQIKIAEKIIYRYFHEYSFVLINCDMCLKEREKELQL